ncbi:MAG: nickel-dependent lactate racemase [Bacillota bacterium]
MTYVNYPAAYGKGPVNYINLRFPSDWSVETIRNTGKEMTVEDIRDVIMHPTGSPTLFQLAKEAKKVGIILEDHTRFTPLVDAFDIVLEELLKAGIKQENIWLIGASATHRATTREDIAKKISADAMKKVNIIEHNLFDDDKLTYIGTTTQGTPVRINSRIAECDLIIGVGGIAPHGSVQYGGGAKLLLPGIAAFDTIKYNHTRIDQRCTFKGDEIRPMRKDMEEAARMVNYAFNVSGFIDHDGVLVDMVAGDPIEAHRKGMGIAKKLYCIPVEEKADVVVACSNPLDVDCFQSIKGLLPSVEFVKPGGTIFWLSECSEGIGTHLLTQMDEDYCNAMIRGMQERCEVANVIFYSGNIDEKEIYKYIAPEIMFFNDLDKSLEKLFELSPAQTEVKILWASPFTVGI